MARPGKYSADCIAAIRAWHGLRSSIPTAAEICKQHRISSQMLWLICRGFIYKVKRNAN